MKDKNVIEQLMTFTDCIELSEDFTLPDYYDDMIRVLDVRAQARTNGKYVGAGNIDIDGDVIYSVTFMNPEGKVKNAVFSSPVSESYGIAEIAEAPCVGTSLTVISHNHRMLSPRKINLRSKVVCEVAYTCGLDCGPLTDGMRNAADEPSVQLKTEEIKCTSFSMYEDNDVEFSENFEVGGSHVIVDIIKSDMYADACECRVSDGKATVNCNVMFKGLFLSESGEYFCAEHIFQISHEVDVPDLPNGACCFPTVEIKEQGAGIADAPDSGEKLTDVEFSCDFKLLAVTDTKAEICTDAYSTAFEEDLVFETADTVRSATERRITCSMNIRKDLAAEGIGGDIIYTGAELYPESTSFDQQKKKSVLTGNCIVKVIYKDGNGAYSFAEFREPYKYEADAVDSLCEHMYITDCGILSFAHRNDGEALFFDCELAFSFIELCREKTGFLKKISLYNDKPVNTNERCGIKIYYPYKKEPIWDVAKKYRLPEKELKAANRLSDESGFCEGKVVIPVFRNGKNCIYSKNI